MWPNNAGGFGNVQIQGDLNNNNMIDFNSQKNDLVPQPTFEGFAATEGYIPQLRNNLPYDKSNGTSFGLSQPQNQGAFTQSQLVNGAPLQISSTPPLLHQSNTPSPARALLTNVKIDARTAELKARLMRRKNANSATPAATPAITNPQTASPSNGLQSEPSSVRTHEQDLETMISELSSAVPVAQANIQPGGKSVESLVVQHTSIPPSTKTKSVQAILPGAPGIVLHTVTNGKIVGNPLVSSNEYRHSRQGSEMSEGEILDEPSIEQAKVAIPTSESSSVLPRPNLVESPRRSPEQIPTKAITRNLRNGFSHKLPPVPHLENPRRFEEIDEKREERSSVRRPENRNENRPDFQALRDDRHAVQGPERSTYSGQDFRVDDYRRPEHRDEMKREEVPTTLAQLLPFDRDLREWLLITGYHNVAYRDKILGPRRQLAALDEQRAKLVAEMARAEREAPPPSFGQSPSLLLPSASTKQSFLSDYPSASSVVARDFAPSNKRSFSDVQDSPENGIARNKLARPNDPKNDQPKEQDKRPRSREDESAAWRDDRDGRYEDRRPPRSRSRDREASPGQYGFEGRPPVRNRSFDDGVRGGDNGEQLNEGAGPRPNLGKNFDQTRGKGRGRGRGVYQRKS